MPANLLSSSLNAPQDGVVLQLKPKTITTDNARMFIFDVPQNGSISIPVLPFAGKLCVIAIETSGTVEVTIGSDKITIENGVSLFSLILPSSITDINFTDVANISPTCKISITSYSLSSSGMFE